MTKKATTAAFTLLTTLALFAPAVAQNAGDTKNESPSVQVPEDRIEWHIPDPEIHRPIALKRLETARTEQDKATEIYISRVLDRVDLIRRDSKLRLSLQEAILRALETNYAIQIASYNPALETTRVVEAEAAFDTVFFTNITNNNIDRPSASQLTSTDLELFTSSYGIRKLTATGMALRISYQLNRTKTALSFQQLNPEYTSSLVLEMRQPLLRAAGIDYNRAFINITNNDRRISDHTFRRQIRDTIRTVEELYWRLAQARRDFLISARLLADFEAVYEYLLARQDFDITPVQIAATKADLEQSRAEFIVKRATVYDAEDRLIATMNSTDIDLADNTEIIPTDLPRLDLLTLDRLGEVQVALDNRTEIKEQELRVATTKITVGRAKSDERPRFDLTFRTTIDGLSGTADRSFDELSRNKFHEYFVGIEFEVPFGNRGPKAAHYRARLQHDQAVAALKQAIEDVILDASIAVRLVGTAYDALGPSFESAVSREREVESIIARAERKDLNTLNSELAAHRGLANARRSMLSAMVEYNVAIIDLERAKGTLLEHHNITIPQPEN